ncbi:MAG: hypothetical protein K0U47_09550 [Epsilonproteobacteria bacterium]|nr:hypothetical protein [Campylobacterota bacterium]
MKTLLFAINSTHKYFFQHIAKHIACDTKIVHMSRDFSFSLKALQKINQVDFSDAIDLRVKDFFAKNSVKIPQKLVYFYYQIVTYFYYIRYFAVIDATYGQIVLWNGISFRQAIAVKIAKLYEIDIFYIENGLLPNTLVIDPKGVNAYNSVPRTKVFYETYVSDSKPLPDQLVKRVPKNRQKFIEKRIDFPNKFIFIPFQIDHDTQILVHSPWIKDMMFLYDTIEKIATEVDEELIFVFKEHPSNRKEYPDLHMRAAHNPRICFMNEASTQALIEHAQAIITINSTVGVESLLFYKKVITLGNAFYNIEGIVKSAQSTEVLARIVSQLDSWKVDQHLITNFIAYLYYDYLFEGTFESPAPTLYPKLEKLLQCKDAL